MKPWFLAAREPEAGVELDDVGAFEAIGAVEHGRPRALGGDDGHLPHAVRVVHPALDPVRASVDREYVLYGEPGRQVLADGAERQALPQHLPDRVQRGAQLTGCLAIQLAGGNERLENGLASLGVEGSQLVADEGLQIDEVQLFARGSVQEARDVHRPPGCLGPRTARFADDDGEIGGQLRGARRARFRATALFRFRFRFRFGFRFGLSHRLPLPSADRRAHRRQPATARRACPSGVAPVFLRAGPSTASVTLPRSRTRRPG